jgi:hypothetical protein
VDHGPQCLRDRAALLFGPRGFPHGTDDTAGYRQETRVLRCPGPQAAPAGNSFAPGVP